MVLYLEHSTQDYPKINPFKLLEAFEIHVIDVTEIVHDRYGTTWH